MRICFIVDYYPPDRLGGVGESARYLKDALSDAGHQVIVLTTGSKSDDPEIEKNVIRLGKRLFLFPAFLFFVVPYILLRHGTEILHIHHSIGITALFWKYLFRKHFPAIVTTFKCSRPFIVKSIKPVRFNNKEIFKPRFFEYRTKFTFSILQYADKYLANSSDYCTSNSDDTRQKNISNLGINKNKIDTVHNGVDLSKFNRSIDGKEIRNKFSIKDSTSLLMYVGGFSVRKRIPLLFYLLKEILKQKKDAKLMVIGYSKAYMDDLKKLVIKLSIKDNVIFTGFVKNTALPDYYAAADIMIVPSEYEPFGIINIEAMAMGKPVIATTAGGMGDIIINGETGFLLEKDDNTGLITRIKRLIKSSTTAKKMGSRGYQRVCENFTWENICNKYIEVYRKAIGKK